MNNPRDTKEEAYKKGYESEDGFLDNPYPDNTDEARHWVDGKVQAIIDARNKSPGG